MASIDSACQLIIARWSELDVTLRNEIVALAQVSDELQNKEYQIRRPSKDAHDDSYPSEASSSGKSV
ncbi:hypothetical protein ACFL2H_08980 [Planctomycetota bacterium]